MKSALKVLAGGVIGFTLFQLASHPHSKVHKRLPEKKIRNVQVLPHIKIHTKDKHIWLHHWINLGSVYAISLLALRRKAKKLHWYHGFMLGGIIQGLLYKDRFHIIRSIEEIAENVTQPSLPANSTKSN